MLVAAAAGAAMATLALPVAGQAPPYRAPRTASGKPDLNGIWQAVNEANYDIQAHMARPAMALRAGPYGPLPAAPVLALGAVGAVPPGLGVVEGDELPYRPEALARKKENQDNWLTADPEIKCYLPGVPRATYMPYPFQILQSDERNHDRLRVRGRGARHLSEGSRDRRRSIRGWASRSVDGTATRWSST